MPSPAGSTLSLHDALPIFSGGRSLCAVRGSGGIGTASATCTEEKETNKTGECKVLFHCHYSFLLWVGWSIWYYRDRKSTRLNSSHVAISYAVFCLKKKN